MDVDSYIEHYEKRKNWTHLAWPKHQERLRECASNLIGDRFADVGCAFGYSTYYLSKFKPGDWTGIDFSRKAIVGSIRNFPDLKFMFLNSINDLGFLDEFDSVVCSGTIEHIEDDKLFFNRLLKLTKQRLIITTPHKELVAVGHLRIYDETMLRALIGDLEFRLYKKGHSWFAVIEK